ncbi:MAG: hypothetical protein OEV37_02945 [Candidatus Berkelbacteria bacterium]|nr:hypothetical protein [Candidatus Berkelbacteria bacterium]
MKKLKSFTLIELILYLALAGAIVIGISSLLVTIIQVKEKNKVIYEVEYQGTRLMDEISQSVRNARSVNAPDPGTSTSSLSLATDNPATNPTIFSLLEDKANIKEGAADPVDLTSSNVRITDLNFENSAIEAVLPDAIRIIFTVSYNAQDNRREHIYQKTYQTTVVLRNSP